jgi:hypothetical protein
VSGARNRSGRFFGQEGLRQAADSPSGVFAMGDESFLASLRRLIGFHPPAAAPAEGAADGASPRIPLPLLREIEDRLDEGPYREAAVLAFQSALTHALEAYRIEAEPGATTPELLDRLAEVDRQDLAVALAHLYDLYRPARFGPPVRFERMDRSSELSELVQEIYAKRPMWTRPGTGDAGTPAEVPPTPLDEPWPPAGA